MTAGWGTTHTEYSTPGPLHGVQLWAALPDNVRFTQPGFEYFTTEPVRMGDHEVAVFVGEFGDSDSPVQVYSPLCAAEIRFTTADPLEVEVPENWEFGVLADSGTVQVDDTKVPAGALGYLTPGRRRLRLQAHANAGEIVRALVIGGEPLGEDIIAWSDLHLASERGHTVQLATPRSAVHRLDSRALANLVSRLDTESAAEILTTKGPGVAADVVRAAHPAVGERVLRAMPDPAAARIVAAMPAEHAGRWRELLARAPALRGRPFLRFRVWPRRRHHVGGPTA